MRLNDVDDAVTFAASSSDTYNSRSQTATAVNWTAADVGAGYVASPDIKSIVQLVIDRVGWQTNNSIAIITSSLTNGTSCRARSWDYSGNASGAKFNCTYTAGGASAIPAIMHHYRQLRSR